MDFKEKIAAHYAKKYSAVAQGLKILCLGEILVIVAEVMGLFAFTAFAAGAIGIVSAVLIVAGVFRVYYRSVEFKPPFICSIIQLILVVAHLVLGRFDLLFGILLALTGLFIALFVTMTLDEYLKIAGAEMAGDGSVAWLFYIIRTVVCILCMLLSLINVRFLKIIFSVISLISIVVTSLYYAHVLYQGSKHIAKQ